MEKCITYVGLDVHQNSIDIALADSSRESETRYYGTIDGSLAALDKVVRKLVSKGNTLRFAYEAGSCGYKICRHLTRQGLDCIVVAPSLIPKKSGNRIKNDRRDAEMLARLHRSGELTAVYVRVSRMKLCGICAEPGSIRKAPNERHGSNWEPSCCAVGCVIAVRPSPTKSSPGCLGDCLESATTAMCAGP